jgi:hypothetical protein
MTTNMGTIDRLARLALAAVIAVLYLAGQLTGWAAFILGAVAAILVVTAAIGWCPLYVPFHVSTRRHG